MVRRVKQNWTLMRFPVAICHHRTRRLNLDKIDRKKFGQREKALFNFNRLEQGKGEWYLIKRLIFLLFFEMNANGIKRDLHFQFPSL